MPPCGQCFGQSPQQLAIAAGVLIGQTRRVFQLAKRVFVHASGQRSVEELAGAIDRTFFRRDLRRLGQGRDPLRGLATACHLTLEQIDHVPGCCRQCRQPGQQELSVGRLNRTETKLTVVHGIKGVCTGLGHDLGLPHVLLGAFHARQLAPDEIVRNGHRVQIAQALGDLLELACNLDVGVLRACQLERHGAGIGIPLHFEKKVERAPQRLRARRPGHRLVPGDELGRDDALPTQLDAEFGVGLLTRHIALVRQLLERTEGVIALFEVGVIDGRQSARHLRSFLVVPFDFDQLREQRRDPWPIFQLLRQLLQASKRVKVLGVGLKHDVEQAHRVLRLVERPFVQLRQRASDIDLLVALQRLDERFHRFGRAGVVVELLLEMGDRAERVAVLVVDVGQHRAVALERSWRIVQPVGHRLSLAQCIRQTVVALGQLHQTRQQVHRFLVVLAPL